MVYWTDDRRLDMDQRRLDAQQEDARRRMMVAANYTVERLYEILVARCTRKQVEEILSDLSEVEGNTSFKDTVVKLIQRHIAEGGKL